LGKAGTKHLKLFMEMKIYLPHTSSKSLKDSERYVRSRSVQQSRASHLETVAKLCEMVARDCQMTAKLMLD
jgi:hypothetical protein